MPSSYLFIYITHIFGCIYFAFKVLAISSAFAFLSVVFNFGINTASVGGGSCQLRPSNIQTAVPTEQTTMPTRFPSSDLDPPQKDDKLFSFEVLPQQLLTFKCLLDERFLLPKNHPGFHNNERFCKFSNMDTWITGSHQKALELSKNQLLDLFSLCIISPQKPFRWNLIAEDLEAINKWRLFPLYTVVRNKARTLW